MVICSSEGCDESGTVDSFVAEVPRVQSAGSPPRKHDMIHQCGFNSPLVSVEYKMRSSSCESLIFKNHM